MNPVGAVIILLAIVVIITGIKGTQSNIVAALKGASPSRITGKSQTTINLNTSYSGSTPTATPRSAQA